MGLAVPAHAYSVTCGTYGGTPSFTCVSYTGYTGQQPWGYPVDANGHNCTNYASYRLWQNNVNNPGNLGNAMDWDNNATGYGVPVNNTPAVGSIAVWEANHYPAYGSGHVAYVDAVTSSYIDISEDNYGGTTMRARYYVGEAAWPDHFIHFKDVGSTPPPPSSGWIGVGNATFLGTSKLVVEQKMYKNQYIMSPAGRYVLLLQPDGNLVLYSGTQALWASGTGGKNVDHVKVQNDGNMVIYGSQGGVWGTNTAGRGGAATALHVQDDGNVVMYNGATGAIWGTNTFVANVSYNNIGTNNLVVEQRLYKNQYLTSPDKRYILMLQSDGNLILYAPGYKPLWVSGTGGMSVDHVKVQNDGNMVIYGSQGGVWGTNTAGRGGPATVLNVQNDGNVVMYNGTAGAIWATNTTGRLS